MRVNVQILARKEAQQKCAALLEQLKEDQRWIDVLASYEDLHVYAAVHGYMADRPGSIHEALQGVVDWDAIEARIGFAESEEEAAELGGQFMLEVRQPRDGKKELVCSRMYATADELVWDLFAMRHEGARATLHDREIDSQDSQTN